jgi:hypothetical protein
MTHLDLELIIETQGDGYGSRKRLRPGQWRWGWHGEGGQTLGARSRKSQVAHELDMGLNKFWMLPRYLPYLGSLQSDDMK